MIQTPNHMPCDNENNKNLYINEKNNPLCLHSIKIQFYIWMKVIIYVTIRFDSVYAAALYQNITLSIL